MRQFTVEAIARAGAAPVWYENAIGSGMDGKYIETIYGKVFGTSKTTDKMCWFLKRLRSNA